MSAQSSSAPAPKDATAAGNYFVSNYPPYSVWKPEFTADVRKALERLPAPGTPLGIYVHVPFCRKRCHFCYFKVYTDKTSTEIKSYLDETVHEMEQYARMPFIGGRKANFVYFGGGTPSYLSSEQLFELSDGLKRLVSWDEAEEITFECEPGTLTEHKLRGIKKIGVTRLSLGIENFDDHILEVNGRAHRSKEVQRAYDFARGLGFEQVNIDLIAGMVDETEENWKRCVEKAIELEPDSITIYQMEIPFNTTIYKEMKAQGKLTAPVADWDTKREWVRYAFETLEARGYAVASAYTAVRDPKRTKFIYRDRLWQGADLVGLGVASFSHVGGTHFQNETDWESYLARLNAGELPTKRALTPTAEERLIREWILQLKLGRVQFTYFDRKFGGNARERFAEPLRRLEEQGLLKVSGEGVVLTRDGLLRVDGLLPNFYLPQHRDIRYV
ncbi:MAG: coproporphyrinogen III oxidase family protein [Planctomycetes bacterium]|nr:coproporphyrinogen III oxidase family protein [Planctomycetota bacterium]